MENSMEKTLIQKIEEVFFEVNKPLHVDEISLKMVEMYPNTKEDLNTLPRKISSVLSKEVKKKSASKFSKPKNKRGGYKRGFYRLKQNRKKQEKVFFREQPKVTTQYTGRAGEHAVLSELLFWGFNASLMAVDDGIDVVASKNNSYFHIQIKTSNGNENTNYAFNIFLAKFEEKDASSTFYIFVLRRMKMKSYINEFLVLPSSDIKRMIDNKIINRTKKLSLRIKVEGENKYILNGKEAVSRCLNNFSSIV